MTYKRIPRRKPHRPPADSTHPREPSQPGHGSTPDAMEGFRPGPGNTGSMDGREETGRRQVNHEI